VADAGSVALHGMVDTDKERAAATKIAKTVSGVTAVSSDLRTIRRPRR
jgi:osmotically-inducible protein OsmY